MRWTVRAGPYSKATGFIAGAGGFESQGVQQSYDLFVIGTDEALLRDLQFSLFPNPVVDQVPEERLAVLQKPFSPTLLLKEVRGLLDARASRARSA